MGFGKSLQLHSLFASRCEYQASFKGDMNHDCTLIGVYFYISLKEQQEYLCSLSRASQYTMIDARF